jgi:protease I
MKLTRRHSLDRAANTETASTIKLKKASGTQKTADSQPAKTEPTQASRTPALTVEYRTTPRPFDPFTSTDLGWPEAVAPPDPDLVARQPLRGKKVAVLVESQLVPQEIQNYAQRFTAYGGEVHFVSRLWDQPQLEFHSRYDPPLVPELRSMVVNEDLSTVDLSKGEFAAVIQSVHTQQRLLYEEHIVSSSDPAEAARQAPAVQLIEKALKDPKVVVGAFGHGAEILAPLSDVIAGARLTTSPGSIANLANTGATLVNPADPDGWTLHNVVETKDGLNLVTAMSILHGGNEAFIDAIARLAGDIRDQESNTQKAA